MQDFVSFLKSVYAYESFMYNFKTCNEKNTLRKFLNEKTISFYIFDAFTWDETYEGWEYWSHIDKKWLEYLINNGKQYNQKNKHT